MSDRPQLMISEAAMEVAIQNTIKHLRNKTPEHCRASLAHSDFTAIGGQAVPDLTWSRMYHNPPVDDRSLVELKQFDVQPVKFGGKVFRLSTYERTLLRAAGSTPTPAKPTIGGKKVDPVEMIAVSQLSDRSLADARETMAEIIGGEGCMIQRHWIEATYLRTITRVEALQQAYIMRLVTVDWGNEAGAGTWVCLWGLYTVNGDYYWTLLDIGQFSGEFDAQGERAALWGKERGMELALCDYGHKGSRDRYFKAILGQDRVFLVDHNIVPGKTADRPWTVTPIELLAKEHIFKISKDLAFDHMVALLSRKNPPLRIPYGNPLDFSEYLEQLFNIYRGPVRPGRTDDDDFEVVGNEREGFKKHGPIHIADCFKFLLLTMIDDSHFRFFLSRRRW